MASLRTATQEKIDVISNFSDKTRGRMNSITVMIASYVGVSSRLELLHASGRSNILNAVAKGSFIHH
jgi:hypothetical protein